MLIIISGIYPELGAFSSNLSEKLRTACGKQLPRPAFGWSSISRKNFRGRGYRDFQSLPRILEYSGWRVIPRIAE